METWAHSWNMYAAPFKGSRDLLEDRHKPNFKPIRLAVVGLGIHNESLEIGLPGTTVIRHKKDVEGKWGTRHKHWAHFHGKERKGVRERSR